MKPRIWIGLVCLMLMLWGCQSTYYNALDSLGYAKRDQLVNDVEAARDSQKGAQQQFQSALDQFRSVVDVQGGELEQEYDKMNASYQDSKRQVETVSKRIDTVQGVAAALFEEWENELDQYSEASLRRRSEQKLNETRQRYKTLISAMKRAEDKMMPVLAVFHDQVLFMKHNLNARAIGSLQGELARIEGDVDSLVMEMQASIAEANRFISAMQN